MTKKKMAQVKKNMGNMNIDIRINMHNNMLKISIAYRSMSKGAMEWPKAVS